MGGGREEPRWEMTVSLQEKYRGRIAPTPSGYLHLGHARTFWIAQQRARIHQGALVFRNEDLDRNRCQPEFVEAMFGDLHWFGLRWDEGPDVGGPFGPYAQGDRFDHYSAALQQLRESGHVYPCTCSRQDVLRATQAPHAGEDEPIYPGTCRLEGAAARETAHLPRGGVNWRFRVPAGQPCTFVDGAQGWQSQTSGEAFGDFVVWRKDDLPAYHLAVVVDDHQMRISEVVRGEDLVTSTFRQLLLYGALGFETPAFYHCPLVTDSTGRRLAKRDHALSLRSLRETGTTPEELRAMLGLEAIGAFNARPVDTTRMVFRRGGG